MKKIMFNDKYGLTKAVLEGRKTMTRRLPNKNWESIMPGIAGEDLSHANTPFKAGEIVAVSQTYRDAINPLDWVNTLIYKNEPGWTNKMFVGADLMPHQIFINAVRVERLQDISDEDCLREGVDEFVLRKGDGTRRTKYSFRGADNNYLSPRDAFAALIDRISGKGTWKSNPWVFVYEFELAQ